MAAGAAFHLRLPPPLFSRRTTRCNHVSACAPPRGPLRAGPTASSLVDRSPEQPVPSYTDPEAALLEALVGIQGRGRAAAPRQLQDVEHAVQKLESLRGVPDPTSSSMIEGRWQLIFTTRPGTASPIQRTFVGVDSFKIFQEVYLGMDDPRVTNVVKFSESIGELRVEAAATIKDGKRILFRFDHAAFTFKFLPFKVPYPVPFRLLGDEAKGWLDTTYLSHTGNMRISRGNKGTTFVLQKIAEPRQRLLSAISARTGVEEVVGELVSSSKMDIKVDLETLVGEWQLLWASQAEDESWSSIASAGLKGSQVIKEDGQLENSVTPIAGFSLNARGNIFTKSNRNTYSVTVNEGAIRVGALSFPLDVQREFSMEILYLDSKIRISRLDDYTLVYLRTEQTEQTDRT